MFWARPSDRRGRPVVAGVEANASVGEVDGSSRREGVVPLRPDLPVSDWATLPAYHFRLLGQALAWKPIPEGPWVYKPNTWLNTFMLNDSNKQFFALALK